jgi:hypothetical protein
VRVPLQVCIALAILSTSGCGGSTPEQTVACAGQSIAAVPQVGPNSGLYPNTCAETTASADVLANAQRNCMESGGKVVKACSRSDVLGGCRVTTSKSIATLWFYRRDVMPVRTIESLCNDISTTLPIDVLTPDGMLKTTFTPNLVDRWIAQQNTTTSMHDSGPPADPVQTCVAKVPAHFPEGCKACMCANGMCRENVLMDRCDSFCWGLIDCIVAKCPNFTQMAKMNDFSCFTANCTSFAAGVQDANPCLENCVTECTTSTADAGAKDGG